MQKSYDIKYDEFNEVYICTIEDKEISAEWVVEILTYIAKLYDFHPQTVYDIGGFKSLLETELCVKITLYMNS